MEKKYNNIGYIFLILLVLIISGFYKTYFGLIPTFNGVPKMAHLHAAAFLCWFALLIIQPILIRQKKYKQHRILGKISYGLAILVILTIIGMTKVDYQKDILTEPKNVVLASLEINFLDIVFFLIFYLTAILNSKKLFVHISFIVASTLVISAPGLARLYSQIFEKAAPIFVLLTIYLTLIGFMIFEKKKFNRNILGSPYLLIIGMFMIEHILIITTPNSKAWQWIGSEIATSLY